MLGTLLSMALDNRLSYCNSISLILDQDSLITVNLRHLFMVEVARESSTIRDSPPLISQYCMVVVSWKESFLRPNSAEL